MLRLTDTEYEIISSNAKNASLPLAEYTRKLITGKTPKITYEIVADLPELKKLIGEFGKIGSNLNQIARYFNSGGTVTVHHAVTDGYHLKVFFEELQRMMDCPGEWL